MTMENITSSAASSSCGAVTVTVWAVSQFALVNVSVESDSVARVPRFAWRRGCERLSPCPAVSLCDAEARSAPLLRWAGVRVRVR